MKQILVELDDNEMAGLEMIARQLRVEPAEVLKAAAMHVLMTSGRLAMDKADTEEAKAQRREARLAIMMRSSGIFEGDRDKPKDGLIYQKELRAEW